MSRGEKQSLGWRPSEYTAFQTGQGYCYHLVDILGKVPLCLPTPLCDPVQEGGSEESILGLGIPSPSFRRRQWQPIPVLLPGKSQEWRSLMGCSPWGCWELGTAKQLYFHFHTLEKEMATHSSILAQRIPGTGEPGGLPSMGSHRVGHNWSGLAAAAAPSFTA